jgi:EAL domain-containing protein (putative c-di-GMP-specific phosphodiesterase class I)
MYCRRLAEQGHDLNISVNLSVRDLMDEYLPYHVLQILKDHDVQPRQLTLEVTESSIMEDVGHAVLVLECLRDIGVRISMDDFGTGHSSLSQLRNIPLHELKIDKSFVMSLASDTTNESIVRTTISLAQDLDLSVVAEGVEDEATMRRISELGCQQAQGFFLSKPLPYDDLVSWLEVFKVVRYGERRNSKRAFSIRK